MDDETRYRLLSLLEANPQCSQRELARTLGISLGKVNYCLQALLEKGMLKAGNFKNSQHKRAYLYLLTPKGVKEKAVVTARFLRQKEAEQTQLTREIESLRAQVLAQTKTQT